MVDQKEKWIGFELKAVNNLIRRNLDVRFAEAGLDEVSGMQGPILDFVQGKSRERIQYPPLHGYSNASESGAEGLDCQSAGGS